MRMWSASVLQRELLVGEDLRVARRAPRASTSASSCLRVGCLATQGAGGDVVDAGGDADLHLQRGALGLVLLAGARLGRRVRADELEAGLLDGGHELLVLGHEAVAGEDRVVAVVLRDLDDLVHPLDPLLLGGAGVVGHPVDAAVVGELAQLGSERVRVDDGVLLGEQDAVVGDPHLLEDVHGLLADRAAADDERLQVLAGEGAHPLRGATCPSRRSRWMSGLFW